MEEKGCGLLYVQNKIVKMVMNQIWTILQNLSSPAFDIFYDTF